MQINTIRTRLDFFLIEYPILPGNRTVADVYLSTHEKQERFSSHLSVKAIFLHHHPAPEKVCVGKRDTQSHVIWNEQNATELPGFGVILSPGSLSVREKLECFLQTINLIC